MGNSNRREELLISEMDVSAYLPLGASLSRILLRILLLR